MQKLALIERWAKDPSGFIIINNEKDNNVSTSNGVGNISNDSGCGSDRGNEQTTKEVNGGKGSGNFGHVGRPGEVGGSSTSGMTGDSLFESDLKNKVADFQKLSLDEQVKFCERAVNETQVPESLGKNGFQKISYALGLNNKPQVLSDQEFDKQVEQDNLQVLHRAVSGNDKISARKITDQLKQGEYTFQGNGMTEGTFFTTNPGLLWKYDRGGDTARTTCAIGKNAKIANFDNEKLQQRFSQLQKRSKNLDISTLTSMAILSAGFDGMSYNTESVGIKVRSYVCFIRRDNMVIRENYDTKYDKVERTAV